MSESECWVYYVAVTNFETLITAFKRSINDEEFASCLKRFLWNTTIAPLYRLQGQGQYWASRTPHPYNSPANMAAANFVVITLSPSLEGGLIGSYMIWYGVNWIGGTASGIEYLYRSVAQTFSGFGSTKIRLGFGSNAFRLNFGGFGSGAQVYTIQP